MASRCLQRRECRTIARIAERWVVLGQPLDGRFVAFDEADVIRRAAHWIVRMEAREAAERLARSSS